MSVSGKCGVNAFPPPRKTPQVNLKFWHNSGSFLFNTLKIFMDVVKNQSLPSV